MKLSAHTLLSLCSLSALANAVSLTFYSNFDDNCGLEAYSIDTPAEAGCTTLEYGTYGVILNSAIANPSDCLVNLFSDTSCNNVANFLNGDTQVGKLDSFLTVHIAG
jgi:hypothetical protein